MNPAWEWQTPPLTVKTPIVFREFVTEWLLKKKMQTSSIQNIV